MLISLLDPNTLTSLSDRFKNDTCVDTDKTFNMYLICSNVRVISKVDVSLICERHTAYTCSGVTKVLQIFICTIAVADPGFPVGGRAPVGGGCGVDLRCRQFGENVYKNERIGSHRGWHAPGTPPPPPRSANALSTVTKQ